jgi:hypothetical protein
MENGNDNYGIPDPLFIKARRPTQEETGELVFYYSHKHRMERAPKQVRDLNEGKLAPKRSFFGKRANIPSFISVLVICGMALVFSYYNSDEKKINLSGNKIVFSVTNEQGVLTAHITKTRSKTGANGKEPYTGQVEFAISPVEKKESSQVAYKSEGPLVFAERLFFTFSDTETYTLKLPFDGERFLVIFQTGEDSKNFRITVK